MILRALQVESGHISSCENRGVINPILGHLNPSIYNHGKGREEGYKDIERYIKR